MALVGRTWFCDCLACVLAFILYSPGRSNRSATIHREGKLGYEELLQVLLSGRVPVPHGLGHLLLCLSGDFLEHCKRPQRAAYGGRVDFSAELLL